MISNGTRVGGFIALQLVNTRASLLGASSVIDDIALDKYTFLRDAYLQRRRSLVFDGDVPPAPDEKDDGERRAAVARAATRSMLQPRLRQPRPPPAPRRHRPERNDTAPSKVA